MSDRLTERETETMLTIIRCGENAYGPMIRDALAERTGDEPSVGAHSILERLERKGFVETRMGEATPERGGKRKRYYRLNGAGQLALQRALRVQEKVREGIALPGLSTGGASCMIADDEAEQGYRHLREEIRKISIDSSELRFFRSKSEAVAYRRVELELRRLSKIYRLTFLLAGSTFDHASRPGRPTRRVSAPHCSAPRNARRRWRRLA